MTEGMIPALATVWGAYAVALAIPGPNVLAVIGSSLLGGRLQGLCATFGVALGTLAWCAAGAFGLEAVLAAWPALAPLLPVAGGIALAVLGLRMLRDGTGPADATRASGVLRGLVAALSNPLNLVVWTSFGSIVLAVEPTRADLAVYAAGSFALALGLHGAIALAVTALPRRPSARAGGTARVLCGGAFLFLGGLVAGS